MTDVTAWSLLRKSRYKCWRGMIYNLGENHKESEEERDAINFLCDEYDYGFYYVVPEFLKEN